ncbi:hypothetical protein DENIS_1039 [Desulfonema ishimotonii]|uniref:DUF4381 domain-containing protein n=2 Tax=Desulfonema ishimotonii TaxID=45657 RepID=A0A401FT05_9BACT|nr:hypothetical protein DENIS_1039 [Desulfonema ishimotonii]
MADIHDIRPPEPAGFDPAILWYLAGAVAALAFLAGLFYGWKRRKRSPRMTVTPALPPETEAINGLNALSDVQAIDGKDFYFRLSAILRRYIAGRYGINAPEMTTEELLPKLDKAGPERSLLQSLKSLFHTADPVKFAGQYAVTGQMESDLVFARKFVEQTTPSPENGEA